MTRQQYARLTAPAGWHPYDPAPPRCPVHGGYMRFRYVLDMYACQPGCAYYVTRAAWQLGLPGSFAPWAYGQQLAAARAPERDREARLARQHRAHR